MGEKTYAQLAAQTTVLDTDLIATYRGAGPLKKLDASVFKDYCLSGAGGGDLLAANNLSDVANITTARTNLGLGSIATAAAADYLAVANNFSDVNSASTCRTNLGLAIGTDVQAYDAKLAAFAGLTGAANKLAYFTGTSTMATTTFSANAVTLVGGTFSQMRTSLSLVPGTDVQAYSANLAAFAGLSLVADRLPYANGTGTLALATFTSFARTLVDDANQAAMQTTLGLVPGTDVQAYSAKTAAIASLTWAADKIPYFTSSSAVATTTLTSFMRTLLDDTTQAAAQATLGIGPQVSAACEATFAAGSISSQTGYNATLSTTGTTGIYLVTFGSAMSSANYSVNVSGTRSAAGGDLALCGYYNRTTTTVTIRVETNGGSGLAPTSLSVQIIGPTGLA